MRMKISDPLGFAANPPGGLRAALLYGPNRALVTEAIAVLRKAFLPNGYDDFSYVVMSADDLKDNPTRLSDEMSSFGFFAGKKLLHVKNIGDSLIKPIIEAIAAPDAGHFLILEADELPSKSGLRAWAEKADEVACAACYAMEGAALNRFVQGQFKKYNATIASDALTLLLDRLGTDLSPLNGVITQLCDYVGGDNPKITHDHVEAMLMDQAEQEFDNVTSALGDGDLQKLDRALNVLHETGTPMVAVLRVLQSYFYKLRGVQATIADGTSMDEALGKVRPPLFWKTKPAFVRHLRAWPMARLDAGLREFVTLEAACKKTGTPDLALVQQRLIALSKAKIAA